MHNYDRVLGLLPEAKQEAKEAQRCLQSLIAKSLKELNAVNAAPPFNASWNKPALVVVGGAGEIGAKELPRPDPKSCGIIIFTATLRNNIFHFEYHVLKPWYQGFHEPEDPWSSGGGAGGWEWAPEGKPYPAEAPPEGVAPEAEAIIGDLVYEKKRLLGEFQEHSVAWGVRQKARTQVEGAMKGLLKKKFPGIHGLLRAVQEEGFPNTGKRPNAGLERYFEIMDYLGYPLKLN